MIKYTPQNQLSLKVFEHRFERDLDKENRWVKLASLIPWDELERVYSGKIKTDSGRLTIDVRKVIAAIIVKHKLRLDDRGTVQMIKENIYLQYFCGFKSFTIERVIDPSLFVDIRERLCGEEFDKFNKLVIGKSEMLKPHQAFVKRKSKPGKENGSNTDAGSTNRGTLKIDATITDQELKFPTDVDLLNTSRENLDRIIDLLYIFGCDDVILRTYKRIARKKYLRFSIKRRKVNKEIRRVVKT